MRPNAETIAQTSSSRKNPHLRLSPRVDREHRGADEVDEQVPGRLRVEHAKLREDEAREDQQRAQDLNQLMHGSTSGETT